MKIGTKCFILDSHYDSLDSAKIAKKAKRRIGIITGFFKYCFSERVMQI